MSKQKTDLKEGWLSDVVFVEPDPIKETFEVGGRETILAKPDIVKAEEEKEARMGTIIGHGPGRNVYETGVLVPLNPNLTIGKRVLFGRRAGIDIQYDGKKYKILREADCLRVE